MLTGFTDDAATRHAAMFWKIPNPAARKEIAFRMLTVMYLLSMMFSFVSFQRNRCVSNTLPAKTYRLRDVQKRHNALDLPSPIDNEQCDCIGHDACGTDIYRCPGAVSVPSEVAQSSNAGDISLASPGYGRTGRVEETPGPLCSKFPCFQPNCEFKTSLLRLRLA